MKTKSIEITRDDAIYAKEALQAEVNRLVNIVAELPERDKYKANFKNAINNMNCTLQKFNQFIAEFTEQEE